MQQSATNNLKPLVLLGLSCCRNCCKLLHLLQKPVAETVADMLHLLQKLLQVVAAYNKWKMQQLATGNFLSFFRFCNRKVQPHATLSATHIYSRT